MPCHHGLDSHTGSSKSEALRPSETPKRRLDTRRKIKVPRSWSIGRRKIYSRQYETVAELNWLTDAAFVSVSSQVSMLAGVDVAGVGGAATLDAGPGRFALRVSRRFLGTSLTLACVWHYGQISRRHTLVSGNGLVYLVGMPEPSRPFLLAADQRDPFATARAESFPGAFTFGAS